MKRPAKKPLPPTTSRCEVGPYRGYVGLANYETPANLYHGRILGINDVVTFEGTTPIEVAAAFRDSVDDYLAHCAARQKEPNQPFSGKFNVRVPAELHRQLSVLAQTQEKSLNTVVAEGLQMHVNAMQPS